MRAIPRHARWHKKILKNLSSFFRRFYGSKSIHLNGTPIPVGHFRPFTNGRKKCYTIVPDARDRNRSTARRFLSDKRRTTKMNKIQKIQKAVENSVKVKKAYDEYVAKRSNGATDLESIVYFMVYSRVHRVVLTVDDPNMETPRRNLIRVIGEEAMRYMKQEGFDAGETETTECGQVRQNWWLPKFEDGKSGESNPLSRKFKLTTTTASGNSNTPTVYDSIYEALYNFRRAIEQGGKATIETL